MGRRELALLRLQCQLIGAEGTVDYKNNPSFLTLSVTVDSDKNCQWVLILLGEYFKNMNLNYLSTDYLLINYSGEMVILHWRNMAKFNWVIKIITSNAVNWHHLVNLCDTLGKTKLYLCGIPARNAYLYSQRCQCNERQMPKSCSRWKETKETCCWMGQMSLGWGAGGPRERHYRATSRIGIRMIYSMISDDYVKLLIFFFLSV